MQLVDLDVLSQLDDVELNSTDADYEIKLYEFWYLLFIIYLWLPNQLELFILRFLRLRLIIILYQLFIQFLLHLLWLLFLIMYLTKWIGRKHTLLNVRVVIQLIKLLAQELLKRQFHLIVQRMSLFLIYVFIEVALKSKGFLWGLLLLDMGKVYVDSLAKIVQSRHILTQFFRLQIHFTILFIVVLMIVSIGLFQLRRAFFWDVG